jgi:hypothetical protein
LQIFWILFIGNAFNKVKAKIRPPDVSPLKRNIEYLTLLLFTFRNQIYCAAIDQFLGTWQRGGFSGVFAEIGSA